MPSCFPQTMRVGAAMRWMCRFRPLSGMGHTNLPVQAWAQTKLAWASALASRSSGSVRCSRSSRRVARGPPGGMSLEREAFRRASTIPPRERVLRADAEVRQHQNDPRGPTIDEGKEQVAALEAEDRAAFEKVRDVGAELRGDRARAIGIDAPQPREGAQRRRRVAAAAAEAALQRNPLRQIDRDVARRAPASGCTPHALRRSPDQVRVVVGTVRIVAGELKRSALRDVAGMMRSFQRFRLMTQAYQQSWLT